MAVSLEDFGSELNLTTVDLLGDTITYTPQGGSPATFKAIVDYGDEVERLAGSNVIHGECAVEVPLSRVPFVQSGDVIHLPKTGLDYKPRDSRRDESGDNWLIILKRKP